MRETEKKRERDYSGEEERKSERGNDKVYICHLCNKGVAVLARVHIARLCDCF